MISNPQIKEENINFLAKVVKLSARRFAKYNEYSGNLFISGFWFTLACYLASYLKMIGNLTSGVQFRGLGQNVSEQVFEIFNFTNFLVEKPPIVEILIIILLIKNILFVILFITETLLNFNTTNTFSIIYQIIYFTSYWITCQIEIEFFFYTNFDYSGYSDTQKMTFSIISIFNLAVTAIISLFYSFFLNKVEFNVDLEDYSSRVDSNTEFYFLFIKVCFSVLFSLNRFNVFAYNINLYLGILLILHFIFILYLLKFSFYYHLESQLFVCYFNLCLFYTLIICFLIHNVDISDQDILLLIGYITLLPISKYFHVYLIEFYMSKPFSQITEPNEITRFMAQIMMLGVDKKISENNRILLYGAVRLHEKYCVYSDCTCKLPVHSKLYLPNLNVMYIIEEGFKKEYNYVYILHIIKCLFEYAFNMEKAINPNLHLMYCFFMNYYVGNFFYSLYFALNLRKNEDLTLQQRISLERILEVINKVLEINFNKIENSNSK